MKNWTKALALLLAAQLTLGASAAEPTAAPTTSPTTETTEVAETTETTKPTGETEETQPTTEATEATEPTQPATETTEATQPTTEEAPPPTEAAPEITADGHVLAKPGLLEQISVPEGWSREALRFCVANEILQGRGDSLAQGENATRAEMAAMLVRLLGLQEQADLSRFTDADPKQWYYRELSAAVAAGIVKGTSETTLSPDDSITREQVFAMLARAFALCPENGAAWKEFGDSRSISPYARGAVSALRERSQLGGYPDKTLRPQNRITREEIAQMFYNVFTQMTDRPEQLPQSGRVLYRGTEPIPKGYVLDGDLTVTGSQSLQDLSITGELVLRAKEIQLHGCEAGRVSVGSGVHLLGTDAPAKLGIGGQGAVVELNAAAVTVSGSCTLRGSYEKIRCPMDDIRLTVDGTAGEILVQGNRVTVNGVGSAKLLELQGRDCTAQLKTERLLDRYGPAKKDALKLVETVVIWDETTRDTNLYSSSGLSSVIRPLPKGTRLEHFYYDPDRGDRSVSCYTEDGAWGYVPADAVAIPESFEVLEPYEPWIVEGFVNAKGYSSATDWLVWVSLKTQTVNIFRGSKENWRLDRSFRCCTGKPATPTIRGSFAVDGKVPEWNFGSYRVNNVTGFHGGYAFHSVRYSPDYSKVLDGTLGKPASHGCVRMEAEGCGYIYKNIPRGSRVIVY